MSFLNPKGEPVREGNHLTTGFLNKLRDGMPRQLRGGGDIDVEQFGDRYVIRDKRPTVGLPDSGNYYAQFVVREELDDYLLCTPFNQPFNAGNGSSPTDADWVPQGYDRDLGSTAVVFVYVAKPYFIQKSPWHGRTVEVLGQNLTVSYTALSRRTLTDTGGAVQTQQISPPYLKGEIIRAAHAVTGLTSPNGYPVAWADENAAARQWVTTEVSGSPMSGLTLLGGPVNRGAVGGTSTAAKYESWWRDKYQSQPVGDHFYLAGGGGHNATAVTDTISPVYVFALPFVTPRAGTIKHIGMYLAVGSFGDQCRVGLYDTTALLGQTGPGNLLCQAQIFTGVAGNALIDVDATSGPVTVAANSLYWLAFSGSASLTVVVRQPQDLWPIFGVREQGAFSGEFHNVVGWKYARAAYAILPNVFASDATGGTVVKLVTDEAIPLLSFTYKTLP